MTITRMCVFIVFLTLGLSVLAISQQKKGSAQIGSGQLVGNAYQNESIGIRYKLPNGYEADQGVAAKATLLKSGALLLLIADQHTGRPLKNRLLLVADEQSHYDRHLSKTEYVTKILQRMFDIGTADGPGKPYSMKIAGYDFVRADLRDTSGPQTLYKAIVCTEVRGYFVSWTFVSSSQSDLAQLADSVRNVSFF